jgi:Pyruvate/2-oxoacid:ferredoxin oxidoreductase delta subunit
MAKETKIILCKCENASIIAEDVKAKVLAELTDRNIAFEAVEDICRLAATNDERLKQWAIADNLTIIACFPRAVKWLFSSGGAKINDSHTKFFNMRNNTADQIVASLLNDHTEIQDSQTAEPSDTDDWTPWFPVIDYNRCNNCKQCLNFCLFGVYQLADDGKIDVAKPANCKTNCPACARVCPQLAIMFPKYAQSPINGDDVKDEDVKKTADTLSGMGDKDIYQMLRQRTAKKKRFAPGANPAPDPSIMDWTQTLDIPPEVLASLSPAEIAGIKNNAKANDCPNSEFCDNDCKKESGE